MVALEASLGELIVRRLTSAIQPQKIILFGSRAQGAARLDSDIDLLVIVDSDQPRYRRASALYGLLSDIVVPMDILVYTPQEVAEWSAVPQAFVTTAVREGVVLYEKQG
jgi:predicted nucleotidyltransferase